MLSTALMKAPLIAAALGTKSLSGRALCKEEADVDGGSTTEAGREEKSASRSSSVAMGIMGSGPPSSPRGGSQHASHVLLSQGHLALLFWMGAVFGHLWAPSSAYPSTLLALAHLPHHPHLTPRVHHAPRRISYVLDLTDLMGMKGMP